MLFTLGNGWTFIGEYQMGEWFFIAPFEETVEKKAGPGKGWWAPPKGTHTAGAQAGAKAKPSGPRPSWAGGEGVRVQGYDVYPGKYAATKKKWAVSEKGELSLWASSPEQAVAAHEKSKVDVMHRRKRHKAFKEDVGRAKTGDKKAFQRVAGSTSTIPTGVAIDALRELGLRAKDAKAIVNRMGIYGESARGTVYRSVDELYARYIKTIKPLTEKPK